MKPLGQRQAVALAAMAKAGRGGRPVVAGRYSPTILAGLERLGLIRMLPGARNLMVTEEGERVAAEAAPGAGGAK